MQKNDPSKNPKLVPSYRSQCRALAGGDLAAGDLLYDLYKLWNSKQKKLVRFNKEWIAYSRDELAFLTGLTIAELKNRALPKLREHCKSYVEIKVMRVKSGGTNLLWFSLDLESLGENAKEASSHWNEYAETAQAVLH